MSRHITLLIAALCIFLPSLVLGQPSNLEVQSGDDLTKVCADICGKLDMDNATIYEVKQDDYLVKIGAKFGVEPMVIYCASRDLLVYTVEKGDTLVKLGVKFKVPALAIFKLNKGKGKNQIKTAGKIYPGQKLVIPRRVTSTEPSASRIKSVSKNLIKVARLIHPGQKLVVPRKKAKRVKLQAAVTAPAATPTAPATLPAAPTTTEATPTTASATTEAPAPTVAATTPPTLPTPPATAPNTTPPPATQATEATASTTPVVQAPPTATEAVPTTAPATSTAAMPAAPKPPAPALMDESMTEEDIPVETSETAQPAQTMEAAPSATTPTPAPTAVAAPAVAQAPQATAPTQAAAPSAATLPPVPVYQAPSSVKRAIISSNGEQESQAGTVFLQTYHDSNDDVKLVNATEYEINVAVPIALRQSSYLNNFGDWRLYVTISCPDGQAWVTFNRSAKVLKDDNGYLLLTISLPTDKGADKFSIRIDGGYAPQIAGKTKVPWFNEDSIFLRLDSMGYPGYDFIFDRTSRAIQKVT